MMNALAEGVSKIDFNNVTNSLLDSIEGQNYSEAGNLMRKGMLSEGGYIASNMIDGLIKCKLESTRAHAAMQVMLVKLAEKTIEGEMKFREQVLAIENKRTDLMIKFNDELQKRLDKALDLFAKALETDKEVYIRAAEKACDMVQASFPVMQEICKSNGMDPAFVVRCTEASTTVVTAMLQAVKDISKKEESELVAMFLAGKEIITKLIDHLPGGKKEETPVNSSQAQLMAQQGMFSLPSTDQSSQVQPKVPSEVPQLQS